MHAASFYGHGEIIKLLLYKGGNPNIKNSFGNYPVEEAYSTDISKIFNSYQDDLIGKLFKRL